jgi:hypothetical protein
LIIFGITNPARIKPYGRPNTVAAIDPDKRGSAIENPNPTTTTHVSYAAHN